MRCVTLTIPSVDDKNIFYRLWCKDSGSTPKTVRGVVHLLHGLGEHSGRYAVLAEALVDNGYVLIAPDHRGHGKSIPNTEELGHFGDNSGWYLVISDVLTINQHIKKEYPNLPIILFGHSMGSFIALEYLQLYGDTVDRVILSGSTHNSAILSYAAHALTQIERLRIGKRGRSKLLHAMAFGQFNKPFKPSRTDFDWLSRDPDEVDKYIADPLCGFVSTTQLWADLTGAFTRIHKPKNMLKLPRNIPYYLFSGEHDPIQAPKGCDRLVNEMRQAGITNIKLRLFPNGRHETLNDTNRREVVEELLLWLNQ